MKYLQSSLSEQDSSAVAEWEAYDWPVKYNKALTVSLELLLNHDVAEQCNITLAYTYRFYTAGHWMNKDLTYFDSWAYYYRPD